MTARTNTMRDQILELLSERRYVTFKELSDEIPGFVGDQSFEFAAHSGLVLWPRISAHAAAILQQMLEHRTIYLHLTPLLNYLVEGYISPLPLAKSVRAYKHPRWIPMTIGKEPPKMVRKRPASRDRKV